MHGTGVGQAQRALLGTIDDGLSAVGQAQDDLDKKAHLPPLGDDAVSINTNDSEGVFEGGSSGLIIYTEDNLRVGGRTV